MKRLTFYFSPLHCGWSSIWRKDLLISPFVLPATPHSLSSGISVFQIVCCDVGPLQWKPLSMYPSLLSPLLTPSLNHFLSSVKCWISARGSLSISLTALVSYSPNLPSLLPSGPDSPLWTRNYQVCCVMLDHWKDYRKLEVTGFKVLLKSFVFNYHLGAFISSCQIIKKNNCFLIAIIA